MTGTVTEMRGDGRLFGELLAGKSLAAAAEAAGMSERTARRHVAKPEFAERLDGARRHLDAVLAAQLADDALVGRRVLRELAEDTKVSPSIRRTAAANLVDLSLSASARDVAARVERLEREREEAAA